MTRREGLTSLITFQTTSSVGFDSKHARGPETLLTKRSTSRPTGISTYESDVLHVPLVLAPLLARGRHCPEGHGGSGSPGGEEAWGARQKEAEAGRRRHGCGLGGRGAVAKQVNKK